MLFFEIKSNLFVMKRRELRLFKKFLKSLE